MIYGSVCSGIEAATAAWHPLGWEPAFFSEVEKFPSAVLAHHYPGVPNYGDMTKFKEWPNATIDVLVGGTPCQSFSVAGLRGGMADPRGNLALVYLALADRYRPKWLVWENVPGVLSSSGGRDFGSFLGGLVELGYGFAYRVLDAQYFGVAQRRRRVFVVGYLGDWRPAAAVLFEPASLRGDPAPRREARQGAAGRASPGAAVGSYAQEICGTLNHSGGNAVPGNCAQDWNAGMLIPEVANPLTARMHKGINTTCDEGQTMIAHSLRGEGFDASEDGTGRGTPLVPVAFSCKDHGADAGDIAPTLRAMGHDGSHANGGGQVAVAFDTTQITSKANRRNPQPGDPCHTLAKGAHAPAIAFGWQNSESQGDIVSEHITPTLDKSKTPAVAYDMRGRDGGATMEGPHDTANIRAASGGSSRSYLAMPTAVRRLTPRECERLQGFADDFTAIPWRGKPAEQCPDGPRYKALGNSMAVPCMAWIGKRIEVAS
jgi:DNA (cytosine-5)-methyltransferase 1